MNKSARVINTITVTGELAMLAADEHRAALERAEADYNNYLLEREVYAGSNKERVDWLVSKGLSFVEALLEVKKEEREWEDETFRWLNDPVNHDHPDYSDIYKDFYGCRPR